MFHNLFRASGPEVLDRLGPVRARIYGRDARGTPPGPTSAKIGFRQALTVLPFVVKGFIGSKYRGSPFFEADQVTPISPPQTASGSTKAWSSKRPSAVLRLLAQNRTQRAPSRSPTGLAAATDWTLIS